MPAIACCIGAALNQQPGTASGMDVTLGTTTTLFVCRASVVANSE